MKKTFLLIATALLASTGAWAQTDVTAQYIPNADFESCEALTTTEVYDVLDKTNVNVYNQLYAHWNTLNGTDYESTGWKLVCQEKNGNGGVVSFEGENLRIQITQTSTAGEPMPTSGITGKKGLCFVGNKSLVYQQANEITLPAGTYKLTVNLYARNGVNTNPTPTQQVRTIKTGFMPTGGTIDNLIPVQRKSALFTSNGWSKEELDIELTEPTKGRFQISYGTDYFVIVDDIKLESLGNVVTTPLFNATKKAEALNKELNDNTLTTAIAAANQFLANPTNQDDVTTQTSSMYAAMTTALAGATSPVNITAAYLENASFETSKSEPWEGSIEVCEPLDKSTYIVGTNHAETKSLKQTIEHLPAGFYLLDAKLRGNASMLLGTTKTTCKGGTKANSLYLRVNANVLELKEAGSLVVGAEASNTFEIDDFRLFYGKDETSLLAKVEEVLKADAATILFESKFANITGSERDNLQSAVEANTNDKAMSIDILQTTMTAFANAKDAYDNWVKAKANATGYNLAAFPFCVADYYKQIQTLLASQPTSADEAKANTTALNAACINLYVSNAYAEGVSNRVDFTNKIVGANATGTTPDQAWTFSAMTIRTDKSSAAYVNPKTNEKDVAFYGVTTDYYRASATGSAYMEQTIANMPAGKYVFAVAMMASTGEKVDIRIDGQKMSTNFTGSGTLSSAAWKEVVVGFEKAAAGNLTIRLESTFAANYKEWYAENLRLFGYDSINEQSGISTVKADNANLKVYDLQGRRVARPAKGLYIVGGKKVMFK